MVDLLKSTQNILRQSRSLAACCGILLKSIAPSEQFALVGAGNLLISTHTSVKVNSLKPRCWWAAERKSAGRLDRQSLRMVLTPIAILIQPWKGCILIFSVTRSFVCYFVSFWLCLCLQIEALNSNKQPAALTSQQTHPKLSRFWNTISTIDERSKPANSVISVLS